MKNTKSNTTKDKKHFDGTRGINQSGLFGQVMPGLNQGIPGQVRIRCGRRDTLLVARICWRNKASFVVFSLFAL
jgi:hypothetical protein